MSHTFPENGKVDRKKLETKFGKYKIEQLDYLAKLHSGLGLKFDYFKMGEKSRNLKMTVDGKKRNYKLPNSCYVLLLGVLERNKMRFTVKKTEMKRKL